MPLNEESSLNVLWNAEQRRLRAFWRLVLQTLLLELGGVLLGTAAGVLLTSWFLAQPGSAALRSDPTALAQALSALPVVPLINSAVALLTVLGSVWVAGRFLDHRRFADFGFHLSRAWWMDLAFGLALGAVLMALIFLVEWAAGWVQVTGTLRPSGGLPFLPSFLLALAVYIAVGFYEELLSRGYQLRNTAEGLNWGRLGPRGGIVAAWVISSIIFGALHGANPNATWGSSIALVVAGLFLGLPFILTGELALSIGLHITWNLFEGNVFGFAVSGTSVGASFISIAQGGPAVLTGGAFGPEAGLVGILAAAVGGALVILWVRWRRGRAALCIGLAEPPARAPGA